MLVKLLVVGFLVWLTISFLHLAISERQQALHLQDSLNAQEQLFETSNSLSNERAAFSKLLNSSAPGSQSEIEALQATIQKTDQQTDLLINTIRHQLGQVGVDRNLPTTVESNELLLTRFNKMMKQLAVYRSYSVEQVSAFSFDRDPEIINSLQNHFTNGIELIRDLSEGLQYLPDRRASLTTNFHNLNYTLTTLTDDLALKNLYLENALNSNGSSGGLSGSSLYLVNDAIRENLERTHTLLESTREFPHLKGMAANLSSYYYQDYTAIALDIISHKVATNRYDSIEEEWQSVSSSLMVQTRQLAQAGYTELRNLIQNDVARSTRNLIIDILLLGLCALIVLASILENRKIKQLAYRDPLTGLPNRNSFETSLMALNGPITGKSGRQAVIFLNLDRFKSINDNYGRTIGDQLIKAVAARLKKHAPTGSVVARIGGDEFSVLIEGAETEQWVIQTANDLTNKIRNDLRIEELHLKIGASAGVSVAPEDCSGGIELLRNADIAMSAGKSIRLEGVNRFNQQLANRYQHRLEIELDLKKALENNEFTLVYQPKVCTVSGRVKSVEALLRWQHAERGIVSPAEFIPVAEDIGMMGKIGDWVLNKACQEIQRVQNESGVDLKVAVNISAQQFNDEHFLEKIYNAIETHDLQNQSLELEVTESLVMTEKERVVTLLRTLKDSGVTIAIPSIR